MAQQNIKPKQLQWKWLNVVVAMAAIILLLPASMTAQVTNQVDTVKSVSSEVPQEPMLVLKGKVTAAATAEELPFSHIVLKHKGMKIGEVTADSNGMYSISIPASGSLGKLVDVEISYPGYWTKVISGVTLVLTRERLLSPTLTKPDEIDWDNIIHINIPFVDPYNLPGTKTITKEEIRRSPHR